MKTFVTISACLIAAATLVHAETGIVKAAKLNVRGQAKASAETVTQLNKGDRIVVLEKKTVTYGQRTMNWLKITLPDKASVWIGSKFVKDGVVTGEKVHIRSGAGMNFSVVGQAHQGDKVQVLRTLADWDEIRPLPGCFGWVSSDYVELTPELQPAPPAESIQPSAPAQSAPVSQPAATPPVSQVVTSAVTPEVTPVIDVAAAKSNVTTEATNEASSDVIASTGKAVTLEGVVHSSAGMLIKRPGTHSLWQEGVPSPHVIAYLRSPNIALDQYEGKKVQIIGVETVLENWKNPVVEVQQVQPTW